MNRNRWFVEFRRHVEQADPELLAWIDHNSADWETLSKRNIPPETAAAVFIIMVRTYRDNFRRWRGKGANHD